MNTTLQNASLSVTLSDLGAEPLSVRRGSCEYLWQAQHPDFWKNHAPILFPICGRLFQGAYSYRGSQYPMNIHGFARHLPFCYTDGTDLEAHYSLSANDSTRAQYPFEFRLDITYRLEADTLHIEATILNLGTSPMPFAYGAHPGFNVPLEGSADFSDYEIAFDSECSPDQLIFTSKTCLNTGRRRPFPLLHNRSLPLQHALFEDDAIFLTHTAPSVTLRSPSTQRFVRLHFPEMSYLGLWHNPSSSAPFLCIEPWCGTPSFDNTLDDFETSKADMFHLLPGASKRIAYSITFG